MEKLITIEGISGSGKTYYFDNTGKRASGFQTINGNTYFFSRIGDNAMRTGTFSIDGPIASFALSPKILFIACAKM